MTALLLVLILCRQSSIPLSDSMERIRSYTRAIEFDYTTWTMDALKVKTDQMILGLDGYFSTAESSQYINHYLELTRMRQDTESMLIQIYSDPEIQDPKTESQPIRDQLDWLDQQLRFVSPVAETLLQNQIADVAVQMDLSFLGQTIPPLLFHATPLPQSLIVSPREVIRQDASISLQTNLSLDEIMRLENGIADGLNVSSLVEDVGGVGTYPTMVQQSSDINWLCEVIAHEWIHNYLQVRPLGWNYDTSPELRTMNETTASLAGKEIALEVLRRHYPASLPPPESPPSDIPENISPTEEPDIPEFDFREEMHATRIQVDDLLSQGKIDEAESFMEEQRKSFWENGYQIRKLNQAYFAFHGAYADTPGGAAGSDPVGPAVRELRARSSNLAEFVKQISSMTSFEQLQDALNP